MISNKKLFEVFKNNISSENLKPSSLMSSLIFTSIQSNNLIETPEYLKYKLLLNETLIDHFFQDFTQDLIYNESKFDDIIDKLNLFCNKHNIKIIFNCEDKYNNVEGEIRDNIILLNYSINSKKENIVYVFLHELSHYVTNTSLNGQLKQFNINLPLTHDVNINSVNHICQQLNYFFQPVELSNWAFTFSLLILETNYKSASEFYNSLKTIIKNEVYTNKQFTSDKYIQLPQILKQLYCLILYIEQLKILDCPRRIRVKYKHKLMSLVKIMDKYIKRVNKLIKIHN